jgi:hypothetical protein
LLSFSLLSAQAQKFRQFATICILFFIIKRGSVHCFTMSADTPSIKAKNAPTKTIAGDWEGRIRAGTTPPHALPRHGKARFQISPRSPSTQLQRAKVVASSTVLGDCLIQYRLLCRAV